MKKFSLLLGVLAILCFSNLTFSQFLFSEDFTGLTVGTIVGQSGWTQGSGALFFSIANTTPLTYTGYNGGGAEYAVMPVGTATAARVFKTFTPTGVVATGNVYYFSFLLNLTQTFAMGATTSNYCLALGDAAGSSANLCPKLYARTSGAGFNIGISKQSTTNTNITWGASVLNLNQTYLIVEKYVFNTLGAIAPAGYDDAVYLWVNPDISSEPVTGSAECQNPGTINTLDFDFDYYQTPAGGIGSVIWNSRGVGNPVGAFDGIRLAYGSSSAAAWTNLGAASATPVELTSFSASVEKGAVNLSWNTATEINNMGFNVERSANKSDWTKIAFVQGHQNSTSTISYSYVDKSVSQSGTYYYRLKQIDNDGSFKYSSITEISVNTPSVFSLNQNYPNPFNPSTIISYSLPIASNVKLIVYNSIGQPVRVLENGFKNAGTYNVSFNASELSSGIYFCKIEAGQFSSIRKMMLVK
jgi:hypothetical protein